MNLVNLRPNLEAKVQDCDPDGIFAGIGISELE